MTRTRIPYLDYTWNPFGFGCSKKCPGCWAHATARRFGKNWKCKDCAAFKPHVHPERLRDRMLDGKARGVIGVQFTGEFFDRTGSYSGLVPALNVMAQHAQHTYVLLTQEPHMARYVLTSWVGSIRWAHLDHRLPDSWFIGRTIRDQAQAESAAEEFAQISGNLWLSLEPLRSAVDIREMLATGKVKGVVVGQDNRRGAAGTQTLAYVRDLVAQCREIGLPVYVKQLWLAVCPLCQQTATMENVQLAGMRCSFCGGKTVLKLRREAADFPPDLALRQLPWSMPKDR